MNDKKDIKFNSINASSLFHFTKKKETLESILSNGLRFSYAFESISPQITANINYSSIPKVVEGLLKETGIAIPMISFCDIPITRASLHMGRYGKYMIGFDKSHLTEWYKNTINPVLYIHSGNLSDAMVDLSEVYAETFKAQIESIVSLSEPAHEAMMIMVANSVHNVLICFIDIVLSNFGCKFTHNSANLSIFLPFIKLNIL